VSEPRVPFLAAVNGEAVDEPVGRRRDPRATLERLLAPELLAALDEYVQLVAEDVVERNRVAADGLAAGKPWLTAAEAGELLSCTAKAIRARCKRGRLEHRYMGRRLYVSARSIQALGRDGYDPRPKKMAPARLTPPEARPRKEHLP
jgi:hypothetical protein